MRVDRDVAAAKGWAAWGGLLEPWWRYRVWIAGAVTLLYGLGWTGVWRMEPDSALYANLGRSLAAGAGMVNGKGLADDSPVGLPLVLALTGGPGRAAQMFMLACAGASLGLGYLMLRRAVGPRLGLTVMLLTATNRLFFEMSVGLLTEIPFMVGLMMVGLGHELRREGVADPNGVRRAAAPWRAWGLIGLGFGVMGLFRSVVVVVAAAYVLSEAWDVAVNPARRRVAWLLFGGGVSAGVGGLAWTLSPAIRDDLRIFLLHVQAADPWWMASNVWELMTRKLVELVLGLDLDPFTALVFSTVVVAGGLMLVRVCRFWAVLWAVSLTQWVVFMPEARYALPMLPMLLLGLLLVGARLTGWLAAPHRGRVRALLFVVIAGANAVTVVDEVRDQHRADFYASYRSGKYGRMIELADRVRSRAPSPDTVVVTVGRVRAEVMAQLTGLRVVEPWMKAAADAELELTEDGAGWRVVRREPGGASDE